MFSVVFLLLYGLAITSLLIALIGKKKFSEKTTKFFRDLGSSSSIYAIVMYVLAIVTKDPPAIEWAWDISRNTGPFVLPLIFYFHLRGALTTLETKIDGLEKRFTTAEKYINKRLDDLVKRVDNITRR